jgi:hypothetical protein
VPEKEIECAIEAFKLFSARVKGNWKFVDKVGWRPTLSVVDIIKDGVRFYQDPVGFPVFRG